jgi:uroporphyrinogen decarboxylase
VPVGSLCMVPVSGYALPNRNIKNKILDSLFKDDFMASGPAKMLSVLSGEAQATPPLWMMRQAGRYLPEYKALRAKAGSFLDLCYNSKMATEVTLQPIRRFGFDATILFSDILVVPHALGQAVTFAEGEGPRLDSITDMAGFERLKPEIDLEHLSPVFDTVSNVRAALSPDVALIGFCGAPWTVASYMIAGKGTPDQAPARIMAYRNPEFLQKLVDLLVTSSIAYLSRQIEAGAQVVQIFESFASALPPGLIKRWSFEPMKRILDGVKARHPDVKVILFARGAGLALSDLAAESGADGLGLDWGVDITWAASTLPPGLALQGNLDPLALIAGGTALDMNVDHILNACQGRPHIFNLGHGILPETPISHVEALVRRVRKS